MSRWDTYLTNAAKVIIGYNGRTPLSACLKNFFKLNKQMGSGDRKIVSGLVYAFYRVGFAVKDMPVKERILCGLFLCSASENKILEQLKPSWNKLTQESLADKVAMLKSEPGSYASISIQDIFPWKDELSPAMDAGLFNLSFLQQPELFLRLRPGKEINVKRKLASAGVTFEELSESCLALPNATSLLNLLEPDVESVIQDYTSQRVGDYFPTDCKHAWDCCAGSGGKSILAYDLIPGIKLSVSDTRKSILQNLNSRFKNAGIKNYQSFNADLSAAGAGLPSRTFDLIIADLPCTGSGTWARTPEQLYFFEPEKIDYFSTLQKKIISNVISRLSPGGELVYITCSVFKKENEEVAEYVRNKYQLELIEMKLLEGYEKKADSMFVAVLKK